ncbi:MAG: tRNA (adenosine(37)-N6)-threonylcarbamoyltransferase complex dimerization subunit type 1 TsaB [Gemmatimonadota bacterium]
MPDRRPRMTCHVAFDTSTPRGTVAVSLPGGEVHETPLGASRMHAAALMPALSSLLAEHGLGFADVQGVVVGAGPGSFTGVRVAAATAKALVHVLSLPLTAISSLAAAAWGPLWGRVQDRVVVFDARGERVYWAHFRAGARLETVLEPRAGVLADVVEHLRDLLPLGASCAGDGAERHRNVLEECGAQVLGGAGFPSAQALLELAQLDPDRPQVENPARWQPEYLKPWTGRTSETR